MANLPTRQLRDSIGIDTVTRGIVWATLYLRAINLSLSSTFGDYVIWSILDGKFYAEIKLVYSSFESVVSGLNFILNIQEFIEGEITGFVDTPNTPSVSESLPDEPGTVNTVEKYLYWLASIFAASTYPDISYLKIEVFDAATKTIGEDEIPEPYLKLTFNLPLNYKRYLVTGNVIHSVEKVIDFYIDQDIEVTGNGVIIPSSQFWRDPVVTLAELTAIPSTDLATGVTNPVTSLGQYFIFYRDIAAAPENLTFYEPDDAIGNEGWVTVQGSGGTVSTVNWSQVLNKPTFHGVAFDGNYNGLINKPTIPTALSTLSGWNQVVRSVNGQTPDGSGNSQITVDVGSVDWANVLNPPSLSTLDEWELVTRSVNGQTPDGSGNVVVTVNASATWNDVTDKPDLVLASELETELESYVTIVDLISFSEWIDGELKTSAFTAVSKNRYALSTQSAAFTVTLPTSGKLWFFDAYGNSPNTGFGANNLTLIPASGSNQTIMGGSNLVLDRGAIGFILMLPSGSTDWRVVSAI